MELFVFVLLVCMLLVFWGQRLCYRKFWNRNLEQNICFDRCAVTEDELVKLQLSLQNAKRLPLPALSVLFQLPNALYEVEMEQKKPSDSWEREELFSLLSYQMITRSLTFRCQKRGIYRLSKVRLESRSFLLDSVYSQEFPLDCQLTVYPSCVDMQRFVHCFQNLFGTMLASDFRYEDVFLVRGVREYQPFDSWKNINWNATAKLGSYMVNNYEYTTSRRVALFLNLTPDSGAQREEVAEESIRLVKTWCVNLEKNGVCSSVYTNALSRDNTVIQVDKDRLQKKYQVEVNELLAGIDLERMCRESFWDLWRAEIERLCRDYFLVFVSAYQHEDFQEGLIQLGVKGVNFAWVLPVTINSICRPRKELEKHVTIWDVYWRREKNGEMAAF